MPAIVDLILAGTSACQWGCRINNNVRILLRIARSQHMRLQAGRVSGSCNARDTFCVMDPHGSTLRHFMFRCDRLPCGLQIVRKHPSVRAVESPAPRGCRAMPLVSRTRSVHTTRTSQMQAARASDKHAVLRCLITQTIVHTADVHTTLRLARCCPNAHSNEQASAQLQTLRVTTQRNGSSCRAQQTSRAKWRPYNMCKRPVAWLPAVGRRRARSRKRGHHSAAWRTTARRAHGGVGGR